jgi:hypothetical protein
MWHVVYKEEQNIREKYKKSSKKISVYGTTCLKRDVDMVQPDINEK